MLNDNNEIFIPKYPDWHPCARSEKIDFYSGLVYKAEKQVQLNLARQIAESKVMPAYKEPDVAYVPPVTKIFGFND